MERVSTQSAYRAGIVMEHDCTPNAGNAVTSTTRERTQKKWRGGIAMERIFTQNVCRAANSTATAD